jgi:hypothetical protein
MTEGTGDAEAGPWSADDISAMQALLDGDTATAHRLAIEGAIAALPGDPGAYLATEVRAAWSAVYREDQALYARLRAQAQAAGARVGEIDRAARWKAPPEVKGGSTTSSRTGDWRDDLITVTGRNDQVQIPSRVHNLMLILRNAPEFAGRLRWDIFADQMLCDLRAAVDEDLTALRAQLESRWVAGQVSAEHLLAAANAVAHEAPRHPVREYLSGLAWDGASRILTVFPTWLGTPDDPYHRDAARVLFVGAVRRVQHPGCQLDTMTILQGPQGSKKSSLWAALFAPWYAEITESVYSKDFFQGLTGRWCADFGELEAFGKAEHGRIKLILTSREDRYRAPYARLTQAHPRQNVFVGGTNSDHVHSDATGGRRWVPVRVAKQIDVPAVEAVRDQLWAEAVAMSGQASAMWWEIRDAAEHQDAVYQGDSWEEVVGPWLVGRREATTTEVLRDALHIEEGKHSRADQIRVGAILARLGWVRTRKMTDGMREYVYRPVDPKAMWRK